jgi:hypothetical protein
MAASFWRDQCKWLALRPAAPALTAQGFPGPRCGAASKPRRLAGRSSSGRRAIACRRPRTGATSPPSPAEDATHSPASLRILAEDLGQGDRVGVPRAADLLVQLAKPVQARAVEREHLVDTGIADRQELAIGSPLPLCRGGDLLRAALRGGARGGRRGPPSGAAVRRSRLPAACRRRRPRLLRHTARREARHAARRTTTHLDHRDEACRHRPAAPLSTEKRGRKQPGARPQRKR